MPIDLVNIPREISAVAEWIFMLLIVLTSRKRFGNWKTAIIVAVALPVQIFYMQITEDIPVNFWILGMMGAVLLIFLIIYITCDMNVLTATYHTAKAFVLAEFAASFQWQFFYFAINVLGAEDSLVFEFLFSMFFYIILFMLAFLIETRYLRKDFTLNVSKRDVITIVSIVLIVFAISNLSFLDVSTPISGRYPEEIFYIRSLVDLCGIILIYMHREHHFALHVRLELSALQSVFQNHYNQYMASRENLDLLNLRVHDLKHHISLIRAESDQEKRTEYLNNIEKSINSYGVLTNTGYHVLDTIITSKNILCIDSEINFTYVVDGGLLKFMDIMDISSLFGNALDNAIENVQAIENPEKRLIKLAVFRQKSLLMIKFENYFENELHYQNGYLKTTKKENFRHGYGIKSIRSIANKYGGSITIDTSNNWFVLCVLIPLE